MKYVAQDAPARRSLPGTTTFHPILSQAIERSVESLEIEFEFENRATDLIRRRAVFTAAREDTEDGNAERIRDAAEMLVTDVGEVLGPKGQLTGSLRVQQVVITEESRLAIIGYEDVVSTFGPQNITAEFHLL